MVHIYLKFKNFIVVFFDFGNQQYFCGQCARNGINTSNLPEI